jgi:hypothetical protein
MVWKLPRVDEITVKATPEGAVLIEQDDPLGNGNAMILIPREFVETFKDFIDFAVEEIDKGPIRG